MPKTRKPYPPEFREQMVALVRAGRTPEELSREFEPTAQSIINWVAQADRDEGKRKDGLTSAERRHADGAVGLSLVCHCRFPNRFRQHSLSAAIRNNFDICRLSTSFCLLLSDVGQPEETQLWSSLYASRPRMANASVFNHARG